METSSATKQSSLMLSFCFLVQRLIRDLPGTSASTTKAWEGCQWTDNDATIMREAKNSPRVDPRKSLGMGFEGNAAQTGPFVEARIIGRPAIFGRFVESQLHILGTRGRD